MKFSEVLRLRCEAERFRDQEQWLGTMNAPANPEDRIKSQAAYRIASDKRHKAEAEYQKAFDQWYAEGMPGD